MSDKSDILSVTSFFSVLVHAVIILGVTFRFPEIVNRPNVDNNLEIVLLNSSNFIRDEDAETISVNDNAGGGTSDQEASTPIEFKPTTADPIESIKLTAKSQNLTSVTPDVVLTAEIGAVTLPSTPPTETTIETPSNDTGADIVTTKSIRQLERERLIAKIQKEQSDYQKRPKKLFLSPSTKAEGAAQYLLNWKTEIQRVGNSNLPQKIRDEKLVGIVIISVEINPNGTIAQIIVNTPSRHKILNDYAKQILRQASPFDPFPDEAYFKEKDILVITRSFEFDSLAGFQTRAVE